MPATFFVINNSDNVDVNFEIFLITIISSAIFFCGQYLPHNLNCEFVLIQAYCSWMGFLPKVYMYIYAQMPLYDWKWEVSSKNSATLQIISDKLCTTIESCSLCAFNLMWGRSSADSLYEVERSFSAPHACLYIHINYWIFNRYSLILSNVQTNWI